MAKELEAHLEEKYEVDFHLHRAHYNFLEGNYGGTFYPEAQKELEFHAEKWSSNDEYYDEYPEAIWKEQMTEDITPIINKNFPVYEELMITEIGVSYDLKIGKEIPHYSQLPLPVYVTIFSSAYWSEESEKNEAENLYKLTQALQKQDIAIEITLYFKDENTEDASNKPLYHLITISDEDFESIDSPEDVLNYHSAF